MRMPEETMSDSQEVMTRDPPFISIAGWRRVINVMLDRYIEHQITTDKVITAVLRDVSGRRRSKVFERGKLSTGAERGRMPQPNRMGK